MNPIEKLLEKLKEDDRLISNGEIKENLLMQLVLQNDEELINQLMEIDDVREEFFIENKFGFIFLQDKFLKFLSGKSVWLNSYTRYRNKIGLSSNDELLKDSGKVVIDFPYKDCVLEGGQTKEEVSGGKKEVFYNQVIDKKEIDRLLEPKALCNVVRYTIDGIEENPIWDDNSNLIIKGNNLIALKSLENAYKNRVKLIYIDVPYNTENDSFMYNDKFTRSTWLTFMKNRLEVAKNLLKNDGFLALQINDKNAHYIKVLLDEIFGEKNFVNNIIVKMSEVSGVKMSHVKTRVPKVKEHLFLYRHNNGTLNPIKVDRETWDDEYKILLENFSKEDKKVIDTITAKSESGEDVSEDIKIIDEILEKVTIKNAYTVMRELGVTEDNQEKWLRENAYRICRSAASPSVKKLADEKKETNNNLLFSVLSTRDKIPYIIKSDYTPTASSPRVQLIFAEDMLKTYIGDIWSDINTTGLEVEGGVKLKNGKKPEMLLKRIIEMTTDKDDIVLDFFLGSGTTCAVAHKMNRRYIGIEQLDYGENDSVVRLQNVINGDQTGVSELLNWQKGGSFVYAELMKYNQLYVEKIMNASNKEQLSSIFDKIKEKGFLNYRVNLEEFNINDNEFDELTFEQQKYILIDFLDQNQLYVNYSDIDDEQFAISQADRAFMESFYERGE